MDLSNATFNNWGNGQQVIAETYYQNGQQATNEAHFETTVPEVLAESELWQRVKDAGLVNENNQPTISRTEAALLADMLAEKLGIRNKWKMFETLWQRNNMRGDFNTALGQNKSLAFQDKLKKILR